jgi:hypothetical protein
LRVLIVIPAYNEEASLTGLLTEIRALTPAETGAEIETVVVDDGSADRTTEVARGNGARVLRLCRNLGIGGAVQSGLRLARRENFDYAVQVDGDGQHPPRELVHLFEAARGASAPDLVIGSRFLTRPDAASFRSTIVRRIGIWWLKTILRVVTRLKVSDPTSGMRLYGRRALKLFDAQYPYDFPEPESLALARATRLKIVEVSVKMRERQGGTSSIGPLSAIYYMLKVTIAMVLTFVRAPRKLPEGHDATSD